MAALSAHGVYKAFGGVRALDGVDLDVAPGERVALVGESGSGKTTLLRCFNRMVEPDAGRVEVDGVDVATSDPVALRRRLGYVQQDGGLLPHWDVKRNVGLVPGLLGLADGEERVGRALARVGLPVDEFGARWPRQLSGGQRQRVALARALAAEPSVVLLDEPFGALDAITRVDVQDAFLQVAVALRVSVLLVTHDLREAFRLADRVAVMRAGRIEQVGAPEALRGQPASDYVRQLVDRAGLGLEAVGAS
ncbi:MAG: ATP-binding cassette domain-containing protein [Vicinamibacteria bacterium]|nr:ATP-binding cassette domain-containing protein [Vicinamibacteria bacterium]